MLSDAFPIYVVASCFAKLDTEIDLFSIEDVFYSEFDFELKQRVKIEVVLELVLHHYLYTEGQFYLGIGVCCCCYRSWLWRHYAEVVLMAPNEV